VVKGDEQKGDDQVDNQVLSIGSHAFLHLKWLQLITLQNVIVSKIDAFAFGSLFPVSRFLTINFTTCNLQQTIVDKDAFLGLNRVTTIYFGNMNLLNPSQPFIPKEDVFSQFLLENSGNKLKFNYPIDCTNSVMGQQVKWMLDTKYKFNSKRIELYCDMPRLSIFKYKFESQVGASVDVNLKSL